MEFDKVKAYATNLGARAMQVAQWKHRERIPLPWQVRIVRAANGEISFDDFGKIDWNFEKGKAA